jgi:hypothetical protein
LVNWTCLSAGIPIAKIPTIGGGCKTCIKGHRKKQSIAQTNLIRTSYYAAILGMRNAKAQK